MSIRQTRRYLGYGATYNNGMSGEDFAENADRKLQCSLRATCIMPPIQGLTIRQSGGMAACYPRTMSYMLYPWRTCGTATNYPNNDGVVYSYIVPCFACENGFLLGELRPPSVPFPSTISQFAGRDNHDRNTPHHVLLFLLEPSICITLKSTRCFLLYYASILIVLFSTRGTYPKRVMQTPQLEVGAPLLT